MKFAFVDLSGGDEPSCCDNGLSQHGVWGCVLVCARTGVCAYRNALLQCSVTTPVCCDTSHGASSRKVLKMSRRFVSSGSPSFRESSAHHLVDLKRWLCVCANVSVHSEREKKNKWEKARQRKRRKRWRSCWNLSPTQ